MVLSSLKVRKAKDLKVNMASLNHVYKLAHEIIYFLHFREVLTSRRKELNSCKLKHNSVKRFLNHTVKFCHMFSFAGSYYTDIALYSIVNS